MKTLVICLLLVIVNNIYAQELNAKVILNTEQLNTAARDRLSNFANEIENYLNFNQFTGRPWEFNKINCTFNIFFTASGGELNYSAQLVVNSQRDIYKSENKSLMLSVMDNAWDFEYERGQRMNFDPFNFEPLTSLLDFYALVIIGLDADSWEELSGSRYFERAFNIASQGAAGKFSNGWQRGSYNRLGLVEDLLSEKFLQFRKDYYTYHEGIDFYKKDKTSSHQKIIQLINNLDSYRGRIGAFSVLLKVFFDSKFNEIIEYLKDYEDKEIFEVLIRIDPAHISRYDEAKKG